MATGSTVSRWVGASVVCRSRAHISTRLQADQADGLIQPKGHTNCGQWF